MAVLIAVIAYAAHLTKQKTRAACIAAAAAIGLVMGLVFFLVNRP
jgi:hypothetical protein